MRRTHRLGTGSLLALAAALACHGAARGAGPGDVEHLTLVGVVFVEPIDARRVVVAVSTRMDGASEHLFLYTAAVPLTVTLRMRNVDASVYYDSTGGLRITPAYQDSQMIELVVSPAFGSRRPEGSVISLRQTLALRHYVASPRLQIKDLNTVHETGNCDLAPEACVQVAGQFLPFGA